MDDYIKFEDLLSIDIDDLDVLELLIDDNVVFEAPGVFTLDNSVVYTLTDIDRVITKDN